MAKTKTMFECIKCGYKSSKWMGRCPACGAWDSFVEVTQTSTKQIKTTQKVLRFDEIEKEEIERFSTNDSELDLVLGGGIVPGSLVLIGGSPGVGKSTLMLKLAGNLNKKVLYVAGEESPGQIKIRADRLKISNNKLYLFPALFGFFKEFQQFPFICVFNQPFSFFY